MRNRALDVRLQVVGSQMAGNETEGGFPVGAFTGVISLVGLTGNAFLIGICWKLLSVRRSYFFPLQLGLTGMAASMSNWLISIGFLTNIKMEPDSLSCMVDGFVLGFCALSAFGIKIVIAMERRLLLTRSSTTRAHSSWRRIYLMTAFAYIYGFAMTSPPLFGWSHYEPVAERWYCCFSFSSTSWEGKSFFLYLLIFGFIFPVFIISASYLSIFTTLHRAQRLLKSRTNALSQGQPGRSTQCRSYSAVPSASGDADTRFEVECRLELERESQKILWVSFLTCLMFLLSWLPYALATFLIQFGPPSLAVSHQVLNIASVMAKLFVVYNPVIYGLGDKNFRKIVMELKLLSNEASTTQLTAYNQKNQSKHPSADRKIDVIEEDDIVHL